MFCNTNQFLPFPFFGPHTKPHGFGGLSKHHHMRFDSKIGHGIYEILSILCDCAECTSMIYKPWVHDLPQQQQSRFENVTDCT